MPWEIGLAETQQTLVLNNLRGQIRVQVDGQLKTGRDVVIGALLGADEFGFATTALVATGCLLMRKCHLNTCPVGIATQNPELRKKYSGKPQHVVNFFTHVAEEVRELMAQLGVRKFDELIGRVELLESRRAVEHFKAKGLDFSRLLTRVESRQSAYRNESTQDHDISDVLDRELITRSKLALEHGAKVRIHTDVRNIHRTVGTMLGSEVTRRFGREGLPDDSIAIKLNGTAGQSFGAFLPPGITMTLEGDANDYVGKGLSGGRLVVRPPPTVSFVPHENMIVGNTSLYGASAGESFFSGLAGERFAVRNSGARAVVEGVGDHCCEYMTGGVVVVLGPTGRNFAAGMSGGVAYVYDRDQSFKRRCNMGMVDVERLVDEHRRHELRELVERHFDLTGSERARRIIEHWDLRCNEFVVVMPFEYRKILARMERDQRAMQRAGGVNG